MGSEYQVNSDTFLWNNFLIGNEDAFRLIYIKYVQILFRYGCNFTRDDALIKDCIHDVFVDLSKYHSGLCATNNIKLYLFKSLKRKIIKYLSNSRTSRLENDSENPLFFYSIYYEDDIVENDFEQLRFQQLSKALTTLTPRQKEAIYLKFVSELSYEELSNVMQLNYQSARNLVFRGLEKLRGNFPKNLVLFFLLLYKKCY